MLRAHLQVILWRAADYQSQPEEADDITNFGREIKDNIPVPVIAKSGPAPTELTDVIWCQCQMQVKKCITQACGCHTEHLSCTSYCNCFGEMSVVIHTLTDEIFRL
ncbi:hypothetical protein Pcinc_015050 [Petrolisthes cinctipes]|uniref:Tesmin/TSO1-like CXC domain-containing protein n=1 Tax=Petrolisthes cinctipes TaxID=88211 RepID=A0AAE1KQU8_PETCI|nr:hypothetical protein Pcinc_015050 [Petrolisthes cinctipes]